MTERKHTPGPWKFAKGKTNVDGDTGNHIGSVVTVEKVGDYPWYICAVDDYCGPGEASQANAHLIAAAPELLEACVALLARCEVLDEADCPTRELAMAVRAIAKAKGE